MTLNNPNSGAGFAAEYQVAPAPWLTQSSIPSGGIARYDLSTVGRHLRIFNHDANSLNVGFTYNGVVGTNKFLVPTSGTLELDCRFTSVYVAGTSGQQFSLFVGQTGIPSSNHAVITGSNGFGVG